MKKVIQLLSAVAIGSSILVWAIQAAYAQRGYQAIGGEYILAVIVAIATYYIVGKV